MTHALSTVVTIADDQADNQWQTSNDADAAIANATQDMYTVDFSGGNVTLTSDQFCSAMTFIPSGLSTGRDLTVPAVKRAQFIVHNTDSTDTITVKRGSTSVAVAAGQIAVLYTDGTTNGLAGTVLASGTGGLQSNVTANLTAGFTATAFNAGTKSTGTFTPDPANGNLQRAVNGGAHTLAPPSTGGGDAVSIVIQYTNNGSAGAITTSGFTKKTGDALTTTNGDDFLFQITVLNGFSHLNVVALQ